MAEMQIRGTQVKDGVIRPDGSVAFTADQSMGSHKLTNVTNPSNPQDAATKAYIDAINATTGWQFSAASVATSETQVSGAGYGDLATVGPSVTVPVAGTVAIVWLSAGASRAGTGFNAFMSVDVSGASTVAAADANATIAASAIVSGGLTLSRVLVLTGLTPGSTTFKAKYKNDGGSTWSFANRGICVAYGDITGLADGSITLAKLADIATAKILGRNTAGTGVIEVLGTIPSAVQDNITRLGALAAGPTNLTSGRVAYYDGTKLTDSADLKFDAANKFLGLGLGATAPTEIIHMDHATRPGVRFLLAGVFRGFFGVDNKGYFTGGNSGDFIISAGGDIRLGSASGTGECLFVDNTKRKFGYYTGCGGAITQLTSKATGVTLNKATGLITMNAAALAANTTVNFVLTNSVIEATDTIILQHDSAGTGGSYHLNAQPAAGSATINVRNITAGSLSEAIVIRFTILKSVSA